MLCTESRISSADSSTRCSAQTASERLEEGGDDVKSARPLWAGLHTCYNGDDNGKQRCESERILKNRRSSDCCLQLDNMKMESLVIADQNAAVNLYLGLVHTARHTLGIAHTRSIINPLPDYLSSHQMKSCIVWKNPLMVSRYLE